MENIFDKIVQSAKDISQGVAGQTKTTVTQGKVELELLQAKSDVKKLYTKLGERVYQDRLHPDEDTMIDILHEQIFEQEEKINELERSSNNIRKEQKHTYESVKRDVKRTWEGEGEEARRPEPDEEGYFQMKFCSNCNIGNHPDAEYCVACGYKQD